jgi:hypothetical protein
MPRPLAAGRSRPLSSRFRAERGRDFSRPLKGSTADGGISLSRVAAHRLSLDQGIGDQAPEARGTMNPARLWERALGMREGQRVPGGGHGQHLVERWPRATPADLCSREGGKQSLGRSDGRGRAAGVNGDAAGLSSQAAKGYELASALCDVACRAAAMQPDVSASSLAARRWPASTRKRQTRVRARSGAGAPRPVSASGAASAVV